MSKGVKEAARLVYLIKQALKGNDKAFLTLFQQYEQDIYRTAFIYVKNQSDALDVVQETAYRSFKSIKNLKEPKYFKTWLIKIAISCSIDLLRKQKKVVQLKPEYEEFIPVDDKDDIDLEITIRDLIELLNEDEKSMIILRFYEGLTIKEASEVLDIPLGTAKTILYRALGNLRKKLKGDGVYGQ
ncbi:sigma-70 family RNA polymerase sigma factor [Neobacillus sp. YIM B06451]|uniref:sigma-70 family RNA polymerase sigma factor n=1 Tax=Neobacillus sp. YIM B06451 TaxID=3070994 RepID=UPI00292CD4E4|nr:sigma-70 family RNA polymerase sigma factor [Neobacillus sp. YIM B06451]